MTETTEQYRTRINQLEASILAEPYMSEMRPDLAEGIGKTGNRQADIENQFKNVQTDASNVSPSGAEVAVARGSYGTLGARLTAEESKVIAQFEQVPQQIDAKIGTIGNTKTFKGSTTNSVLLAKTGMLVGDYWYLTDLLTNKAYNGTSWIDIGNNISVGDLSIAPQKNSGYQIGKNLFDKSKAKLGYQMDNNNGWDGVVKATWFVSDKINATGGLTYVNAKYFEQIAFFNSSDVLLSILLSKLSAVAPTGTAYFKFTGVVNSIDTTMVEQGSAASTTYTPFLFSLKNMQADYDISILKQSDEAILASLALLDGGISQQKTLSAFGDSLTAGNQDGSGVSYSSVLASLSGLTVNKRGVGGENCHEIVARQGGSRMMINNITIPSGVTPVQIATSADPLKDSLGNTVMPMRQYPDGNGGGINPCTIDGIIGNMSITQTAANSSDAVYYFTRATTGTAKTVNRPTPLITNISATEANNVAIFFMGQNGGFTDVDDLILQYRTMIDHLKSTKKEYLIIGLPTGTQASRADMEAKLSQTFGRRFVNIREYLSAYGLSDSGITPTTQDITDMSNGTTPTSLRVDNVHLNRYGYTVLGNLMFKRLKELSII